MGVNYLDKKGMIKLCEIYGNCERSGWSAQQFYEKKISIGIKSIQRGLKKSSNGSMKLVVYLPYCIY